VAEAPGYGCFREAANGNAKDCLKLEIKETASQAQAGPAAPLKARQGEKIRGSSRRMSDAHFYCKKA